VSVEVQRNLDSSAAWFARPEGQQADYKFTLRQGVDIAVQSALKSHRAFEPELSTRVHGDVKLMVQDLLLLTDAIFIALDNVKGHSGLRKAPKVNISCGVDDEGEMLTLVVTNTVDLQVRTPGVESRLQELRNQIGARTLGKTARTEGGSGFLKLAAALQHSAEGELQFGFSGSDEFRFLMRLRLTKLTFALVAG
jgi:hypothetical protein